MRAISLVCFLLAALAHAGAAHAHASLIRSEPADRAVVVQPPAIVTLVFNEPVSPVVLRLVGPNGDASELKEVAAENATLTVELPQGLGRGTHLLSWRVISADGHPVGGALTFSIGAPSAQPGTPRGRPDRPLEGVIWAAKFLLYVGLFLGVGGAFYATWIAAEPTLPRVGRLVVAALLCAVAAAILSIPLQGIDALGLRLPALCEPRAWTTGLASSFGITAITAAAASVIAMLAMTSEARRGRWVSLLALVGLAASLAASGHASSVKPQLLTRSAVFLHGITIAFWIGALIPLAAAMASPERRAAELKRFSWAIPVPLLLLIASGLVLAAVELQRVDALWTTAYGLVFSSKLAAVLVLLALAAVNRFALTPHAATGDGVAASRLARSSRAEVLSALVIFGLVALWRFTPPPRAVWAAADAPVHAHIHTDKAMADLEIGPASAQGRRTIVSVLDGQFAPLPAKEVTLFFSSTTSGIEPLRLSASHVEGAAWSVGNVALPAIGRWQVRVEILVNDFEKVSIEDEIDIPR
jgi:copper transport protein